MISLKIDGSAFLRWRQAPIRVREDAMNLRTFGLLASFVVSCILGSAHGFAQNAYITSDLANAVSVIDTTTNKVITTIPDSLFPFGVVVTPDGRKVYVTNDGSQNVSVMLVKCSHPIRYGGHPGR